MRTRSQARRRRQPQVRQTSVESPNLEKPTNNQETFNPPIVTMDDNRTMAQLLEAPTEGYEDAIVVPEINANNFEIKHGLLNLVQNKQFFGHDKEDPHAHIRYFNKITSTMKFPNVPSTSVKLMLFPFSLEGAARIWLDKEPPRSILTWDDLVACPHHGFSELHQLDTFYNALNSNDQDSLNSAAGGNFLDKMPRECLKIIESKSKVRNSRSKPVVAKVSTSTSTSGISPDVSELKDMVKALLLDKKNQSQAPAHQTPASVKAVEESCVTCGGAHSYQSCPATDGNVYHDNIQAYVSQAAAANFNQGNTSARPPMVANQIRPPGFPPMQNHQNNQNRGINFNQNRGNNFNQNRGNNFSQGPIYQPQVNQPPAYQAPVYQAPAPQTQSVSKTDFDSYVKANDAVMRNMQNQNQVLQNQGQNLQAQLNNLATSNQRLESMLGNFIKMNTASTSGSGTLPGNTVTNPKEDLKGITTRSGVTIQGPKAVNHDAEVTKDTMPPANNGSTEDVQPPVVQVQSQNPTSEPDVDPVSAPRPNQQTSIPVSELKDMVKALLLDKKNQSQAPAHQTPASVKAVEESCVTCGGAHSYQSCPATDGNVYHDNIQAYVSQAAAANFNQGNTGARPPMVANQIRPPGFPPMQSHQNNQNRGINFNQNRGNNFNQNRGNNFSQGPVYQPQVNQPPAYQAPVYQAPAPQTQGVSKTDFDSYVKANDAVMRNVQNQGQNLQAQLNNLATSNQRLESMLGNFIKMNTTSTSGSGTLPGNTITNPKEDLKGITTRSGVACQGPAIPSTSSSSPKVVNRDTEVTKDTMFPTNNGNTEDVQPTVIQVQSQNPTSEPVVDPMPNQRTSIPFPSRRNDERRREKANDQIEKFYEIFRDLSFEISFTDALTLITSLNENCLAVILNKLPKKLGDPGRFLIPCEGIDPHFLHP
ncbi:hypothetical protein Tco_0017516 [Tanacetum coccineum]